MIVFFELLVYAFIKYKNDHFSRAWGKLSDNFTGRLVDTKKNNYLCSSIILKLCTGIYFNRWCDT
jgi:hypothetical protein